MLAENMDIHVGHNGGVGMPDKAEQSESSDSEDDIEQLQYKVVILGDGAVGKTSITLRFRDDQFAVQYKQTLGVDFFLKHIVLPGDVHVALSIWDIGGQQIGSNMIGNYIYGAQAVILTYDLTNYQSFQNLEDWLELVEKVADKDEPPYIVLAANKSDLKHNPAVQTFKHNRFSDENCNISFYVSAKTGSGVAPMFNRIAADLSGYVLTKAELEQSSAVLPAVIVNHQQHDPNLPHIDLNKKQKSKCVIS